MDLSGRLPNIQVIGGSCEGKTAMLRELVFRMRGRVSEVAVMTTRRHE